MTISQEDKVVIAKIAFEAESIASKPVGPQAWDEVDEHIQAEALLRVERMLENNDPSIFGRVARSVARTLADAGLILDSEALPEATDDELDELTRPDGER